MPPVSVGLVAGCFGYASDLPPSGSHGSTTYDAEAPLVDTGSPSDNGKVPVASDEAGEDAGSVAVACSSQCFAPYICCSIGCVDVQTDNNNCGGCGLACGAGAMCSAGACQQTVASGLGHPYSLAVDATSVYWADIGRGSLMKSPIGGGAATTLASLSGGYLAVSIAVDATSVYWTDNGSDNVMKVSLGGGTPATLASGRNFVNTDIAVDATSVYWTEDASGAVMKVSLGGGTPTTLATDDDPLGIAVNVTSVYWIGSNGSTVMKAPLGGGTVTTLASGQGSSGGIVVDKTNVYWTDFGSCADDGGPCSGSIVKLPLGGGGSPTALASGLTSPGQFLVVDTGSVYWADLGLLANNTFVDGTGSVMKVPIGGGAVTTIASGQSPLGIAVGTTSVYWANSPWSGPGAILASPK